MFRVAFLAFIIDSQHSMMFGHSLVLHAQELNLNPPCKEDVWAAGSPMEWQRAMQRQSVVEQNADQLGFIEILKIFMNEPHTAKEKISLDPFGSFIALHGLISVKWHLQQKALGMGNIPL
jgi:Fungal specific transcription factor domain